jgi:hypothetical protein
VRSGHGVGAPLLLLSAKLCQIKTCLPRDIVFAYVTAFWLKYFDRILINKPGESRGD